MVMCYDRNIINEIAVISPLIIRSLYRLIYSFNAGFNASLFVKSVRNCRL
jgi:hypothetical protein